MNSDQPPLPTSSISTNENPTINLITDPTNNIIENSLDGSNTNLQPMSQLQTGGFPTYNATGPFFNLIKRRRHWWYFLNQKKPVF